MIIFCLLTGCFLFPLLNGKYTLYGIAVVNTCNSGYVLHGATLRLCARGEWSGNQPVCLPYVCVCVCVYLYVYACVCVGMCMCMCMCIHLHVCIRMYVVRVYVWLGL